MSKKFGTSMFGFKRKKVIDYLESINNEYTDTIAKLTSQLNQTQDALNSANQENENLKANVFTCEEQLKELSQLAQELKM